MTNRIFQFCRLDFSITAPILLSWLEQTDSNLLPTFGKRHRQLGFDYYDDLREGRKFLLFLAEEHSSLFLHVRKHGIASLQNFDCLDLGKKVKEG